KCPACGQWNTFSQELIHKEEKTNASRSWNSDPAAKKAPKTILLQDLNAEDMPRILAPDNELNRVLGGGIVPGSVVLVAGEPGIGKSTLFLQIGLQLKKYTVLYISGEESEQQIKLRA